MMLKKLLLVCACMALAACGGVDPNSPLGKRQALFKEMLKVSEDLGGMLRGRIPYDEAGFITGAAELDRLSREPWQHFPQVRDDERSKANPEVWERQEQFQKMARDLEQTTAALVQATSAPPLRRSELEPAVQAVEDSCEACHKAFRAY
ncbi:MULTISPECIES: cytochrome c [Pseudomonas]|jgi:cytochrome c556|uniref:Cytochrome c556 n=1 Tax=Ectopseudomonas oleovorans TaxID=301 RepID=A0A653B642_ECTOL|nr:MULTISPECIES: cytochrome c [Pseudomonas]QTS86972.1 cytochrome c [Pseudomonas khazarica]CAE6887975.1 Cytochrome c556 [Pseudomonas oleovorans]